MQVLAFIKKLSFTFPLGVLLRDENLEVSLVGSNVVVTEHNLAYGLMEVAKDLGCLAGQDSGRGLVEVESLGFEVVYDAFHGHGVHITKLNQTGDEGRCKVGVQKG